MFVQLCCVTIVNTLKFSADEYSVHVCSVVVSVLHSFDCNGYKFIEIIVYLHKDIN